jgi:hypothetical protein
MIRRKLPLALIGLLALALSLSSAGRAQEADIRASCMGIASSLVSPPASYPVSPEGRAYIAHLTKSTTAPTLGFESPGAYTSYIAQFRGSEIGPECS